MASIATSMGPTLSMPPNGGLPWFRVRSQALTSSPAPKSTQQPASTHSNRAVERNAASILTWGFLLAPFSAAFSTCHSQRGMRVEVVDFAAMGGIIR
ncbi:hypothetical protein [Actinospica robiniae]|uniref:hypothetical protein n=1 Tax=Actinospica robiniae TaxID=304901 RepID=UPI0012FB6FD0|nr:hypothetical protein [Actinospica robiniae]